MIGSFDWLRLFLFTRDNGYTIRRDIEASLDRIHDQALYNIILGSLGYDEHTPDLRLDLLGDDWGFFPDDS